MNISLQNVDKVSAVLTVQIEKAGKSRKNIEKASSEREYAGISQRHGSDDIAQEAVWYVSIGRGS